MKALKVTYALPIASTSKKPEKIVGKQSSRISSAKLAELMAKYGKQPSNKK
jgi:hypothetical protein